jgi:hypothetical protein
MGVSIVDKLNCKMGKHKWQKAYVRDNKYDAMECAVCGIKKYNIHWDDNGNIVKEKKK